MTTGGPGDGRLPRDALRRNREALEDIRCAAVPNDYEAVPGEHLATVVGRGKSQRCGGRHPFIVKRSMRRGQPDLPFNPR